MNAITEKSLIACGYWKCRCGQLNPPANQSADKCTACHGPRMPAGRAPDARQGEKATPAASGQGGGEKKAGKGRGRRTVWERMESNETETRYYQEILRPFLGSIYSMIRPQVRMDFDDGTYYTGDFECVLMTTGAVEMHEVKNPKARGYRSGLERFRRARDFFHAKTFVLILVENGEFEIVPSHYIMQNGEAK